jgi:hypothetical protein
VCSAHRRGRSDVRRGVRSFLSELRVG